MNCCTGLLWPVCTKLMLTFSKPEDMLWMSKILGTGAEKVPLKGGGEGAQSTAPGDTQQGRTVKGLNM
jgi:hypothetical protein